MVNEGAHNWSIILPGEGEEDWPSCVCATHKHTTAITLTIHLDWWRRWGVGERLSATDEDGRGKLNVTLVPNGPFGPVLHVIWWWSWFSNQYFGDFYFQNSLALCGVTLHSNVWNVSLYEMQDRYYIFPPYILLVFVDITLRSVLIKVNFVIFWQWKLSRHNRYSFNFIQCPQAV